MSGGRYAQNDSQTAPRSIERPEQRDGAMAIPGNHQALVEVGTMGGEDVFASAQATQNGEGGVEDKRPNHEYTRQGKPEMRQPAEHGKHG